MTSRPPAMAMWLLDRLTVGEQRESMIGDLIERHHGGRSTAWFWRQALGLIAGNLAAAFWTFRWVAITVMAICALLPYSYRSLIFHWVVVIDSVWQAPLMKWLLNSESIIIWQAAYGLTTGLTSQLTWCILVFAIAWILGRLRADARAVVAITLMLSELGQSVPGLSHSVSAWLHHPDDWVGFLMALRFTIFAFVAVPASILLGGRAATWDYLQVNR